MWSDTVTTVTARVNSCNDSSGILLSERTNNLLWNIFSLICPCYWINHLLQTTTTTYSKQQWLKVFQIWCDSKVNSIKFNVHSNIIAFNSPFEENEQIELFRTAKWQSQIPLWFLTCSFFYQIFEYKLVWLCKLKLKWSVKKSARYMPQIWWIVCSPLIDEDDSSNNPY